MKKHFILLIIFFISVAPQILFAQNNKPKVALVLSGGGANGVAHIPTLQLLDSLGIVPDLIVGTSMGSIVGGLYAMGYSGDSIADIANNADWDEILKGNTPLQDVSVEEKSEYKKYLVDFDLVKGKPKTKSALLSDQTLREFMSSLTYPVYNITDFDDLSIPFRAMATDIVNGKEVIIDKGSLSLAMRASMSIPSIFLPVPYKNTLLIDGGVLNNFPTDIAKSMGADIIIGSDVGGGMEPKEKLDNIPSLLFQTSMLTSNLKIPINRKLCDILILHEPNLTYSTGDFNKSKIIFEQGKIATKQNMDAFVALAEKLKGYDQKTHKLPYVPEEVLLDTILFLNISEANIDLVHERANIKPHKKYSTDDIIEGVNRAMGTNLFDKINFSPIIEDEEKGLVLTGYEKAQHQVKGSLHYDNYRGIGLFVNYTGRNILGEASRFLVSIDIAEQPRFRVQYQKNFGDKKNWWFRSEVMGQNLEQDFYISGEKAEAIDYRFFQIDNQFNKNINSFNSYVGIGINYENTWYKPNIDPEIYDNVFGLNNYHFSNLEIYAQYVYNTMNNVFFPAKGTFFQAELGRSLFHNVDVVFTDKNKPNINGATNGFTKFILNFEKRLVLNKNITGILGASSGFIFVDNLQSNDNSFIDYGYGGKFYLGGTLLRPRRDEFIFNGLHESELIVSQFMKLNFGMQFKPFNSFFIKPHFTISSVGFDNFENYIKDAFKPDGNWQDINETSLLMSSGITASYHSFLGPINFDISWVNNINQIRIFFGVGIQFNRSN